jgi:NAD(P)H dehydrogenase (quinone)
VNPKEAETVRDSKTLELKRRSTVKLMVVYYSMYGHVYKMAQAAVEGAKELAGSDVVLRRVPETLPGDVLEKMGAMEALNAAPMIRVCEVSELATADAIIFGTPTRFGGQESTILGFHTTLLHHGMVIVGLPYSFTGQMRIDEITGGSPYGASTIAGGKGERMPSINELAAASYQGKHVAQVAAKLAGK